MPGVSKRWKWIPGRRSNCGLGRMVLWRKSETMLQKYGNIIQGVDFGVCHLWTLGEYGKVESKGSNRSLSFYFNSDLGEEQSTGL